MDLSRLLKKYSNGEIGVNEIQREISIENIGYVGENIARLDVQRESRRGCPEVILALGKQYNDLYEISLKTMQKTGLALISKATQEVFAKLSAQLKQEGYTVETATRGTTILVSAQELAFNENNPHIGIICAGTSDIPIAEEARMMARAMGCVGIMHYDVGIAGMHRLLPAVRNIIEKNVEAVVVVAGMEGALASVISALVDVPVIGVPTSVGYGMGSSGIGALTSMLQTCSFGLAVMNIDNGIGAGAFAALICKRISLKHPRKDDSVSATEEIRREGDLLKRL
ncbi:MAG TPA: nickel pincer cofactor biosynthesis protein LarB [Nitrososphaeraceae archaeon]|nr:nickel pincer cofactor biosynthesis protein LarB [Nitrososphaeraceae archaeon]